MAKSGKKSPNKYSQKSSFCPFAASLAQFGAELLQDATVSSLLKTYGCECTLNFLFTFPIMTLEKDTLDYMNYSGNLKKIQ